jgi:hypothetical protein
MSEIKKVKINTLIESQIPEFLNEESTLFKSFLDQYYASLTSKSGSIDLSTNIKEYKDITTFTIENLIPYSVLTSDVLSFSDEINVISTVGWPEKYGLLKINDEIITYQEKTATSFRGCSRGFSGIDQIKSLTNTQFLNFSSTKAQEHSSGSLVYNLSNLFIREFFEKFKNEFLPGFEGRDFVTGISISNILSKAKDFYTAKGTDTSYKVLFKILYGKEIEIIKPQDYTIIPSANSYFTTKNILLEKISGGNPLDLKGNFLYQNVSGIGTVSASVFNIEFRPVNDKTLYEVSLDSTSISGKFEVTGKTKILEVVNIGDDSILVDSTIGFSKSGKILVTPPNSTTIELSYIDKTSNQFLGVTGVTKVLNYGLDITEEKFAFGFDSSNQQVNFRIVNVIDSVDFSKTSNLRPGDIVKLSGFGKDLSNRFEFSSWIYNIPTQHTIKKINQQDATKYRIFLYDSVSFYKNEVIEVIDDAGNNAKCTIISVEFDTGDEQKKYSNRILVQVLDPQFNILNSRIINKIINKSNHSLDYFANLNTIPSGVQNTYLSFDEKSFYVTSTGLPNYTISALDTKKYVRVVGSSSTTLFTSENHNFFTGESIYYQPSPTSISGLSTGFYFITNIGKNEFKLSYSKTDLFSKKYITVNPGITSDSIFKSGYENKLLKNQKIFKKFNLEKELTIFDDKNRRTTNNKEIGLLVNGVELLSPTLFDENIYYGDLISVEVTNNGKGYDVVNPPPIEIKDEIGTGAKGHVNISGEVKDVKVITPGIGYQSKPKITITGGNGTGCILESNLVKGKIGVGFKPQTSVSLISNTITFLNDHYLDDGEEVIYDSFGNSNVGGLVSKSHYFVGVTSSNIVKLYNSREDAINKVNEIDIVGISSGFHKIETLNTKNTITKVYVKEKGSGYSNRAVKVPSVLSSGNFAGINTYDSYVFAPNHGFNDGELVVYSSTDTPIVGLNTTINYYIKVIDKNKFRLSSAGIGTTSTRDNYINNKFIKFDSLGIGTHTISYPPIVISVETLSAIGSTEIVQPRLEPVILGQILDVYLEDGGLGYGCTDILNFHRRPDVGISTVTSQCLLRPIIVNGSINDVQIINRGRGYRKDSDIIIEGSGSFADIRPIIDNGRVISVDIINAGVGYASSNTVISVTNRGTDVKFLGVVREWKVNQVVKSSNLISNDDDGIIYPNKNSNLGLQFINFHIPKKLRYSLDDNFTETNKEKLSGLSHSPILGFAYDGNPIYGPYGYDPLAGGSIRQIKTSYELRTDFSTGKRPPGYQPGYFTNDYVYTGSGDLDEYNGRFCLTPQYPNGTYAYFISLAIDATGKSLPTYPYAVGPYFKSAPITDNFLPSINQDVDLTKYNMSRNIGPYYITNNNSFYNLIDKVSDNYKQEFRVTDVKFSGISSAVIFSSGTDYQVSDRLVINNENTSGSSANIVVSRIKGVGVSDFCVEENTIDNVIFDIKSRKITGYTIGPHGIKNGETIIISGITTISSSSLEGSHQVIVDNKSVELLEDIPSATITGISTFIVVKDISGFNVNDVIGIGTETLVITGISSQRSGFYVNRMENSGIHTAGINTVTLLPSSFEFGIKDPVKDYTFANYVTFFDPKETVGVGTSGITRTISLVGIGTSTTETRFIPTRSIYLPNHKFYTGQELIYNPGVGGTSLYVNNVGSGVSFILLPGTRVYAVNLGLNYIGLSTVGFTTSSGIGTTLNSLEFKNFSLINVGSAHSLTTTFQTITGRIDRFSGIVTTSSDHNLSNGDNIRLSIENRSTQTVKLVYNPEIRKVLTDKIVFSSSDVSSLYDFININNNTLKTGDKVLYTADTPISGLNDRSVYYILKTDINQIKLCKYRNDIQTSNYIEFGGIGGVDQGLYLINPPLQFIKNDIIKFDMSDSSLLDMDIEFYSDIDFQRKVELIGNLDDGFAITRNGDPGFVDSYVTIDTSNKHYPGLLYYNLVPKSPIDERKTQITTDLDVFGSNKIFLVNHILNDNFNVSIGSSTEFTFNLKTKPTQIEKLSYNSSEIFYDTNSESSFGPISKLKINFSGRGYKRLPNVDQIITKRGKNAIIKLVSSEIGKVESFDRIKDGFDYPTDPTLTPSLSVPTIVGIKDIRTIDSVGIITGGRNYNTAPQLDIRGNSDIKLKAIISGGSISRVDILQNVTNLKEPLEITPIYNSNGYEIDFITVVGNLVTLELSNSSFISSGYGRTDFIFPFSNGDEIFVEACRLTVSTSNKANFNSSNYGHQFFTLVGVNTVNYTLTYSMSGISTGEFGTYDDTRTLGHVVNKKDMPVFEMILNDNVAYKSAERVTSRTFSANVMEGGWDNNLNQLRLNNSFGILNVGDKLFGEISKINGTVEYFDTFNLNSTLGVTRDKVGQIDNAVGILNDFQQRISDNFYYQKFSYSIKSEIDYDTWRESVRSIIHPSGFREFSDLIVYTKPTLNEVSVGIAKSSNLKPQILSNESSFLVNIDTVVNVNERNNFSLVYEEDFLDDGSVERIFFNEGTSLRNYILNKTNKVIKIDDISNQFDGTSVQTLKGRYADASDLLDLNKSFIQEEVVGFITATYPGITTNLDWDREICKRDVGYIVDAISHDIKYNSNNKSVEAGLAYWSGLGTSYVAGELTETIGGFKYIADLSKFIINNVGVQTSYQLSTSFSISNLTYDNITGITTITTTTPHLLTGDDFVVLKNIVLSCNSGSGISTAIFPNLGPGPDGNGVLSPKGFVYPVEVIGISTFRINPGISTISHSYVNGGTVQKSFISTKQIFDTRIIKDTNCSPTYSSDCCADVVSAINSYIGIVTSIIGIGTTTAPDIVFPSLSRGGITVGVSTFKLKNKGITLFKRDFESSDANIVDLVSNKFNILNHNFQSGQELIYTYDANPIGIATTSYIFGIKDILMEVGNFDGTAIFENGYGNAITTSITGVSTVLVPSGPSSQIFNDVVGTSTSGGLNAVFDVLVTYSISTGQPLSTSISLVSGGNGFSVGDTVSIAGTYFGGINPTNNLSFVISKTSPTAIQTEANNSYNSIPSQDLSGALFNVYRDNSGIIQSVNVINGGSGYASTSVISIAGTYIGGSSSNDDLFMDPLVLGSDKLPEILFVNKLNDGSFRVSGFNTSLYFDLISYGTGIHTFSLREPNASSIITIDGIIQSPVRRKSLSVSLGSSVSSATTTIIKCSLGISSLTVGDIINLDSEYLLIKNIGIGSTDFIGVERGYFGTVSGLHTVGASATVLNGDYNIVGDTIYFTTPPYGKLGPVGLETGSIFGGRIFSRQFDPSQPQDKNIILDDISLSFTGIAATEFILKTSGISTTTLFNSVNSATNIDNNPIILINNVFQEPRVDYTIDGPSENTIKFLSGTPGAGKISKVAISTGFGYLSNYGAKAEITSVSVGGTITGVSLIGFGQNYIQPPSITIFSPNGSGGILTTTVGSSGTITSLTIVNGGSGYTLDSEIQIGIPTSYSNLGLIYSGISTGVGQEAKISVVVGQGSSIISFKFDNVGVGYKVGDILTVPGITTNPGLSTVFDPFTITVTEVQTDKFGGFYPGQFIIFDDVSDQFNGFRKKFTLSITQNNAREVVSLKTLKGSDLDLTNNLFIYINGILQVPGDSYTFSGSRISFKESPKSGSTCSILYYRGSSIDVEVIEPPKTIKEGDTIIIKESENDIFDTSQLDRVVKKIVSSDQLDTFQYNSVGIITDPTKNRPLTWKKQTFDRIINGDLYSKSRPSLASKVRPNAYVIKNIEESDTSIYVDNAFPLFNEVDKLSEDLRDILIVENKTPLVALATCVVSSSSSISSIIINDGGSGYAHTSNPIVTISKSALTRKDPINNWNSTIGVTSTFDLNSLTYGNVFVSVGNSSVLTYSSDGENWISDSVGFAGTISFNSVSCGGTNTFLAVGTYAFIVKSIGYGNTITSWNKINLVEELVVPGLGIVGRVGSSYTGTFKDVTYSPYIDYWVAVGTAGSTFTSPGIGTEVLISRNSNTLSTMNSVSVSPISIVAVGDGGTIISTINGQVWDNLNSPTFENLNKIIYANDQFIIVGDNGTILRSITPSSFEVISTNIPGVNIVDIYYSDLYTILSSTGELYYSFDLSNWVYRSTNQGKVLKNIKFIDSIGLEGRFVSVGYGGTVIYSDPIYNRSEAISSVTSGVVTSILITNGGFGYSQNNPPSVLIEPDSTVIEQIKSIKVIGDYGTIIGVTTYLAGTPGIGTTTPKVDFILKSETYDNSTLGIGYSSLNSFGISYSQLSKGDYFVITNSNVTVGHALTGITTSLGGMSNYPNSRVATATSYLDGVYKVEFVTNPDTVNGIVTVTCNFAPKSPTENYVQVYTRGELNSGINTNNFYGRYSWSKIYDYQNRILGVPKSFETYNNNGISGISTNPQIFRIRGL